MTLSEARPLQRVSCPRWLIHAMVLVAWLFVPPAAQAQSGCADALSRADDLHWTVKFDESNALLQNCLAGFSDEDKLAAFDLQARNFFKKNQRDEARRVLLQLLEQNRNYQPDEFMTSPEYQDFAGEVRKEFLASSAPDPVGTPELPPQPPEAPRSRFTFVGFTGAGIENVRPSREGEVLRVNFDLANSKRPYRVSLLVSHDQGNTFIPVEGATGDVDQWLWPGNNRQITWEVPPGFTERYPADTYEVRIEAEQRRRTLGPAIMVLGGAALMVLVLTFI